MGSLCVLPYMCKDIECLVCRKKCSHEVWCANDFARAENHSSDCYLCQHEFTSCTAARKDKHIVYQNLQSALRPIEPSENLPVLKPPDQEMQSSAEFQQC